MLSNCRKTEIFLRNFIIIFTFTFLSLGSLTYFALASDEANTKEETVLITVDFNDVKKENLSKEIFFKKNMTAMDALNAISKVRTEQSNEYIFVVSIDDIEAEKGVSAWYYNINNKRAKNLANLQTLNPKDKIDWVFEPDICTKKINNIK